MSEPIHLRDRALPLPTPSPQPPNPSPQCTPLKIWIYDGQRMVHYREYPEICDARPNQITRQEALQAAQQDIDRYHQNSSEHIPLQNLRFRIGTSPFLSLDQVLDRAGLRRAR